MSTKTEAIGSLETDARFFGLDAAGICRFNLSGAATIYFTRDLSAPARSVFSQVNSGNSLPKCP